MEFAIPLPQIRQTPDPEHPPAPYVGPGGVTYQMSESEMMDGTDIHFSLEAIAQYFQAEPEALVCIVQIAKTIQDQTMLVFDRKTRVCRWFFPPSVIPLFAEIIETVLGQLPPEDKDVN